MAGRRHWGYTRSVCQAKQTPISPILSLLYGQNFSLSQPFLSTTQYDRLYKILLSVPGQQPGGYTKPVCKAKRPYPPNPSSLGQDRASPSHNLFLQHHAIRHSVLLSLLLFACSAAPSLLLSVCLVTHHDQRTQTFEAMAWLKSPSWSALRGLSRLVPSAVRHGMGCDHSVLLPNFPDFL